VATQSRMPLRGVGESAPRSSSCRRSRHRSRLHPERRSADSSGDRGHHPPARLHTGAPSIQGRCKSPRGPDAPRRGSPTMCFGREARINDAFFGGTQMKSKSGAERPSWRICHAPRRREAPVQRKECLALPRQPPRVAAWNEACMSRAGYWSKHASLQSRTVR
jgi:hypothetical protein